ncbi:MAG: hypothetical protein HFH86_00485 [Bacilli bacterium]|nr:hypothetical protein [Bacilli bacterium]
MNKLKMEELIQINGGSSYLTASFINALARCIDSILEIGRSLGTAIARLKSGNMCS